jgi:hypothetical protein
MKPDTKLPSRADALIAGATGPTTPIRSQDLEKATKLGKMTSEAQSHFLSQQIIAILTDERNRLRDENSDLKAVIANKDERIAQLHQQEIELARLRVIRTRQRLDNGLGVFLMTMGTCLIGAFGDTTKPSGFFIPSSTLLALGWLDVIIVGLYLVVKNWLDI